MQLLYCLQYSLRRNIDIFSYKFLIFFNFSSRLLPPEDLLKFLGKFHWKNAVQLPMSGNITKRFNLGSFLYLYILIFDWLIYTWSLERVFMTLKPKNKTPFSQKPNSSFVLPCGSFVASFEPTQNFPKSDFKIFTVLHHVNLMAVLTQLNLVLYILCIMALYTIGYLPMKTRIKLA